MAARDGASGGRSWGDVSGLAGGTAIVFGVADGIGLAVALAVAGAGARVVCVDLNQAVADEAARRIRTEGGEAVAFAADVTDRASVRAAVTHAVDRFGGVDYCVDVVGAAPLTPVVDGDDDLWDLAIDLNLRQAYVVAGEVLPAMRVRGRGALCFISSIAALASMPNKAAYGAAKAGLVALMKTLAVENAPFGLRVNAVAPGVTATPAIKLRDQGNAGGGANAVLEAVPLGRYGEPSEIASAIVFFLSDLASFVTGQLLTVDGGSSSRYCLPVTQAGWTGAEQMRAYFAMPQEDRLAALARRASVQQ